MQSFVIETLLLMSLLIGGALSRRIAGGLLPTGSSLLGRLLGTLFLAVPTVILLDVRGFPAWWGLGIIPLYYAGMCVAGFPKKPGTDDSIMIPLTFWNVVCISALNGVMMTAPLSLVLDGLHILYDFYDGPIYIVAGLLFGPAYWVARFWIPRIKWLGLVNKGGIAESPPMAELYVGTMIGLATYLTATVTL